MSSETSVITRMQSLIQQWEKDSDDKAVFLKCYMMMTSNMLMSIDQAEFNDPVWVDRLLNRFADYYFVALEAYEQYPVNSPLVWHLAHDVTRSTHSSALQKLLLGVNAHINYDLVLTLVDVLQADWPDLTDEQRAARYADHCRVNEVIGSTIDAVQDQVLEPASPALDLVDRLLGPIDEMLISRLISRWREDVWQNAVHLLETGEMDQQVQLIRKIEQDALEIGETICLNDRPSWVSVRKQQDTTRHTPIQD